MAKVPARANVPDASQLKSPASLTPTIAVSASVAAEDVPEGERKLVTVLIADIKGSTELEENLDPEEARALIDPALQLMIHAVRRYDGYVVQSTGDGIFALFGAPVAHEDHPQRALYAALRMQQELRRYSAKLREQGTAPLELRIGANTGEVVVRSIRTGGAHAEYTPIGLTTSLASRMEALAPTGSIAVTEATQRLCEGYFTFRALGPTRVKGISEPVNVHEVTGIGALRTRLQRSAGRGLSKFVGREREMAEMRRALELVWKGRGQIVAAMGEAGLGKSRLFYEFKATSQSGCLVLETFSVSHGKASAYLPVIEFLDNYFEIEGEDDARKRREKVGGKVLMLDRRLEDTLPYMFALLGVEETTGALAQVDAHVRQRRTLEAIKRILLRESLNQPLLIVFEDLHWVDAETQALLDLLADAIANARVLLLVNYRPEYSHGWGSKGHYAQLRLDPLGRASAEELLEALVGDDADLRPLKRLIIEKTQGNPFFLEETVQVLFDEGALVRNGRVKLTRSLNELRIPPTVQMILASRIDRLPADEKELLQTLAVIGKEFPLGLVRQVAGKSDDDLERMLSNLQLSEFIYEQPALPDVEYSFKHALTHEVAYNSMLQERRGMIHECVGNSFEAIYGKRVEEHLSEIAHHYGRSGNVPKAVDYLKRAAEQASERSAIEEADRQFRDATALLRTLPASAERDREELGLLTADAALLISRGFGAPEREEPLKRAYELCGRVGDRQELASLLYQLGQFYIQRLRLEEARKIAEQAVEVGRGLGPIFETGAWHNLSETYFWAGDLPQARIHLQQALDLCEDLSPRELILSCGFDQWSLCAAFMGVTELLLGAPERALAWAGKLAERGKANPHPYSRALECMEAAWISMIEGDATAAREYGDVVRKLCDEYGFPEMLGFRGHLDGWIHFLQGEREIGISELTRAIDTLGAIGSLIRNAWRHAILAAMLSETGRHQAAAETVARAIELVETTGEQWAESEVYRIAGEVLMRGPDADTRTAEQHLNHAIEVARRQNTRWWELRATTSLAQLLAKTNRRDQARSMLAGVYGWFTEGFETADLKNARALIVKLGG
jgi:class 3 adenylate cyclase/tetratricopeptide (TPR) repeat protein